MYDYITKLCRRQAKDIQNYQNSIVRAIAQLDAIHGKCKKLKLGGSQAYDH
jgi:hypothetical protein